jgi:hypothetical protein
MVERTHLGLTISQLARRLCCAVVNAPVSLALSNGLQARSRR